MEAAVRPAALRALRHDEEDSHSPNKLQQVVEYELCLGIDPMDVLDHDYQGPAPLLQKDQGVNCLDDLTALFRWLQLVPLRICSTDIQQRKNRRKKRRQRGIQRSNPFPHSLGDSVRLIIDANSE